MKSCVKIRNFDGEHYPHAELLDGTKIQMFDVEYESLGTCEITGLTVLEDSGRIMVVQSVDLEWTKDMA